MEMGKQLRGSPTVCIETAEIRFDYLKSFSSGWIRKRTTFLLDLYWTASDKITRFVEKQFTSYTLFCLRGAILMKKTIALLAVMIVTVSLLAGCGSAGPGETANVEESTASISDGHEEMTYMSGDGYQIRYNALAVESSEIDEHSAQFVYIGESTGTNMVTIRYIEDKQPEEALYDLTSTWGDQDAIRRREGFFPGTVDKWGYWRELYTEDGGSGLAQTAIAGEYNGGVLMFEITSHMSGKDEIDIPVSDILSGIVGSITYDNFEPQTMYDYYPGSYAAANGKLVLKDDHNGVLSMQDDIDIIWGSDYIMASDGTFTYEFSIEGDNLYLNHDGEWIEFAKE